jgi:hypothetical protein
VTCCVKWYPKSGGQWLGLVLVLTVSATGCHSGSPPEKVGAAPPPSTLGPPMEAEPGGESTQSAILADYRAYWKDFETAGWTADWDSPRLAAHATGQLLGQSRLTLLSMQKHGLVARGNVRVDPRLLSHNGAQATVYDCNDTSRYLAYDAKTGQPKGTSSGKPHGMTVQLVLVDGTWKAARIVKEEAGRCTA